MPLTEEQKKILFKHAIKFKDINVTINKWVKIYISDIRSKKLKRIIK